YPRRPVTGPTGARGGAGRGCAVRRTRAGWRDQRGPQRRYEAGGEATSQDKSNPPEPVRRDGQEPDARTHSGKQRGGTRNSCSRPPVLPDASVRLVVAFPVPCLQAPVRFIVACPPS